VLLEHRQRLGQVNGVGRYCVQSDDIDLFEISAGRDRRFAFLDQLIHVLQHRASGYAT
jgi:hypothetical protein